MALTLIQGPVVKKLMVLLLLTFSGLGYPPDLGEALMCANCKGEIKDGFEVTCCTRPSDPSTVSCNEDEPCTLIRQTTNGNGEVQKTCGPALPAELVECVKKKMDQVAGPCFKGQVGTQDNPGVLEMKYLECSKETGINLTVTVNGTEEAQPSARRLFDKLTLRLEGRRSDGSNETLPDYDELEYCDCNEHLCNAKDLKTVQGGNGTEAMGGNARSAGNNSTDNKDTKGTGYLLTPTGLVAAITGILLAGILKWTI